MSNWLWLDSMSLLNLATGTIVDLAEPRVVVRCAAGVLHFDGEQAASIRAWTTSAAPQFGEPGGPLQRQLCEHREERGHDYEHAS